MEIQIPFFVPFFACFCGALAYDIFIYTGDSPLNNGSWSLVNLRKDFMRMWRKILVRLGRNPRGHQSDEESLGAKQGQEVATSTSLAGKEGRKSSSSSVQDKDSGKPDQKEKVDGNEPDENTGSESNPMLKNTRKAGYHGEAWEDTVAENRQNQQSGGNSKGNEEKDQETRRPANDTEMQEKEAGENLGGGKAKETGYDEPKKNDWEEVDDHGNEK